MLKSGIEYIVWHICQHKYLCRVLKFKLIFGFVSYFPCGLCVSISNREILELWYADPDFAETDVEPLGLSLHKAQWVRLGSAHPGHDSLSAGRRRSPNVRFQDNTDTSTDNFFNHSPK